MSFARAKREFYIDKELKSRANLPGPTDYKTDTKWVSAKIRVFLTKITNFLSTEDIGACDTSNKSFHQAKYDGSIWKIQNNTVFHQKKSEISDF